MSCFRTTTYGTITPRSARERRLYRARKILSSFFCIPYLLSHTQHGVPKGEGRWQVPGKSFLFFLLPDRIFFSTARPISEGSSSLQRFPGDQLTWSQPQGRAGIQASRPNNTRHFLLFHRATSPSAEQVFPFRAASSFEKRFTIVYKYRLTTCQREYKGLGLN